MIRNPRTGFTIPEHGQKRPPKPGSASSSRKGLFVLLAISALATASQAFAQHRNGSADGLYAVPDAGASASTVPESASKRATESYLSSLDSQGDRFQAQPGKSGGRAQGGFRQAAAQPGRGRQLRRACLDAKPLAATVDSHLGRRRTARVAPRRGICLVVPHPVFQDQPCGASRREAGTGRRDPTLPRSKTGPPRAAPHDGPSNPYHFTNHFRKTMNFVTRIWDLSSDDLRRLQAAILVEVQRRKELSGTATAADSAAGGPKSSRSSTGGPTAPASKPASPAARPARPRRAA